MMPEMIAKITLPGRPMTKKNSQQIWYNRATGKPFVTQSEAYQNYEKACLWEIKKHRGPKFTGPIHLKCLYWMPNHRSWPDLVGLLQATQDILQKAGVIFDDKHVMSLDGSRIMGVDRENPRAEIVIECEAFGDQSKGEH